MGCNISKKTQKPSRENAYKSFEHQKQFFKYGGYLVKEDKANQDQPFVQAEYTVQTRKLINAYPCFKSNSANNSPLLDSEIEKSKMKGCNSNDLRSSRNLIKENMRNQTSLFKYCINQKVNNIQQQRKNNEQQNQSQLQEISEVDHQKIKKCINHFRQRVKKVPQQALNEEDSQQKSSINFNCDLLPLSQKKPCQQQKQQTKQKDRKTSATENIDSDCDSIHETNNNHSQNNQIQNMNDLYPITQQKKQKLSSLNNQMQNSKSNNTLTTQYSSVISKTSSIDYGSNFSNSQYSLNSSQAQGSVNNNNNNNNNNNQGSSSTDFQSLRKLTAVIRQKENSIFTQQPSSDNINHQKNVQKLLNSLNQSNGNNVQQRSTSFSTHRHNTKLSSFKSERVVV